MCFSVGRCICEFNLGIAVPRVSQGCSNMCLERADTQLRISCFGGVDQDLLKVSD